MGAQPEDPKVGLARRTGTWRQHPQEEALMPKHDDCPFDFTHEPHRHWSTPDQTEPDFECPGNLGEEETGDEPTGGA